MKHKEIDLIWCLTNLRQVDFVEGLLEFLGFGACLRVVEDGDVHVGGLDMDAGHHEDLPQPGDTQRHVHLSTASEMEGVQGHLSRRFTYGLREERKR